MRSKDYEGVNGKILYEFCTLEKEYDEQELVLDLDIIGKNIDFLCFDELRSEKYLIIKYNMSVISSQDNINDYFGLNFSGDINLGIQGGRFREEKLAFFKRRYKIFSKQAIESIRDKREELTLEFLIEGFRDKMEFKK